MDKKIFALFMTLIVVIGGALTYFVVNDAPSEENEEVCDWEDSVSLKYYGYFIEDGKKLVFDTNIPDIANDNETYSKSVSFTWRDDYELLNVSSVGDDSLIVGFEDGLIGMKVGETKLIEVPYEKGYGPEDPNLIKNIPVDKVIDRNVDTNITAFKTLFGEEPHDGTFYPHPEYGWDVEVYFLKGNDVSYRHDVENNTRYYPFQDYQDWSVDVVYNNNNDNITIHRNAIESTALPNGTIVQTVTDDIITLNMNKEVAGKTLYFEVTLESLTKSEE